MTVAALIVAAGRGHRAGGAIPKQYVQVSEESILRRTVKCFCSSKLVDLVQVVIHPEDKPLYDESVAGLDVLEPCHGGASRQESVRLGLEALGPCQPDIVLVHDAARPFVSDALIDRVITALGDGPAVIPGVPVTDTIKQLGDDDVIAATIDRATLRRAQTPQAFQFRALLDAHQDAAGQTLTDDAAVAAAAGIPVRMVEGDEKNIKVTTPEDIMALAKAPLSPRIGTGFDVHRLGPGDHVMLCGVRIDHDRALIGHSDADVALHALTDALLGAVGAGDIGRHFPPGEDQWKGAPSQIFVEKAVDLITERGGRIGNVDLTIICEAPKIGPHVAAMTERLATLIRISPDRINIKATTTEQLGFTGRREGIAAQVAATVLLPEDAP